MTDADEVYSEEGRARLGTTLRDKYRLERILGEGGMAVVYAATHRNRQEFAVKLLRPALSSVGDIRTRFLREGYVANSVKHPGAVKVLDDDVAEDGAAFLVMELLDGLPVESLLQRLGGRFSLEASLGIAFQLLDVLAAAHTNAIVHRDIKPANLFLTREGEVKVLDFGIARLRDAGNTNHATQTGAFMGTPAYMSPEQALGETANIDAQSDVWAAGATLFSLLTGDTVHQGDTVQKLMIQAATQPARPFATVAPLLGPEVAKILDRALAFEKAARWPTARAMRDAVADTYRHRFGSELRRDTLVALLASDPTEAGQPMVFPLKSERTMVGHAATVGYAPGAFPITNLGDSWVAPKPAGRSWIAYAAIGAVALTVFAAVLLRKGPAVAEVSTVTGPASAPTLVAPTNPPSLPKAGAGDSHEAAVAGAPQDSPSATPSPLRGPSATPAATSRSTRPLASPAVTAHPRGRTPTSNLPPPPVLSAGKPAAPPEPAPHDYGL